MALPPALMQILALATPFIFGLLIGMLIRRLMGVALILLAIFLLAVALGYMSPSTAMSIIQSLGLHGVSNGREN